MYSKTENTFTGLYDMLNTFFQLNICDSETMEKIMCHYKNNEKWKSINNPKLYILTKTKYRVDALLNRYAEELMS